ncbi:hypothetical protein ACWIUH_01340 [Ursidibacter arcticus]
MGVFDQASSVGSGGLEIFGGNSPLAQIGNTVVNEGISYARANIKSDKLPYFDAVLGAASGYQSQGWAGAVGSILNSGLLNKLVPKSLRNSRWFDSSPLTANLSMQEVQRLVMLAYATEHARKNLWLISISDYSATIGGSLTNMIGNAVGKAVGNAAGANWGGVAKQAVNQAINAVPIMNALSNKGGGMTDTYNFLATDVSYTPFAIEADQHNIGSAIVDGVKSSAKAEISITTMDDEKGTIKRFFKNKASQIVHPDGTVGVTADGLVSIRILHAFVSDSTNKGGFEEEIICRPVSVDYELSRREDAMQEFTMRFEQTDTFVR